ncbi:MAG: hypothetical protein ACM3KE_18935 [Hyphomicrobiales bacterium]
MNQSDESKTGLTDPLLLIAAGEGHRGRELLGFPILDRRGNCALQSLQKVIIPKRPFDNAKILHPVKSAKWMITRRAIDATSCNRYTQIISESVPVDGWD